MFHARGYSVRTVLTSLVIIIIITIVIITATEFSLGGSRATECTYLFRDYHDRLVFRTIADLIQRAANETLN
jgi:hypothetical protein